MDTLEGTPSRSMEPTAEEAPLLPPRPSSKAATLSASEVTFAPLDAATIERYWASGEPHDKAGGYAVQGLAAVFIRELRGSYTGIMGLPLYETATLLARAGITHALSGAAS